MGVDIEIREERKNYSYLNMSWPGGGSNDDINIISISQVKESGKDAASVPDRYILELGARSPAS